MADYSKMTDQQMVPMVAMPGLPWSKISDLIDTQGKHYSSSSQVILPILELIEQLVGKDISELSILDIGCKTGNYLLEMAAMGCKVTGTEKDSDLLETVVGKQTKAKIFSRLLLDPTGLQIFTEGNNGMDAVVCFETAFNRYAQNSAQAEPILKHWWQGLDKKGLVIIEVMEANLKDYDLDLSDEIHSKVSLRHQKVNGDGLTTKLLTTLNFEAEEATLTTTHSETYRWWSAQELQNLMFKTGFEEVNQTIWRGRVFVIAKKLINQ